jgi:hypothetical protein
MVYSRLNIIRVTTRSITRSKRRKSLLFLSKQSGERGFRCVTLDELAQDRSGSGSWPDILWPDMVSFGLNRNQAVCVRLRNRPRLETHSSSEISAAIRRVERRDQAADKAPNEPNEGRHPSQQGHVNEYVSDREQKV